ncbi:MAG: RNA polymerase sigma factor [Gemmataceae bacterium]|nr:RNA polymerase sigma factor [Gemmataceae bacterium]
MMNDQLNAFLCHLRRAIAPYAEVSDSHLLRAFAERNDQAAFAQIVRRHGPLVMGVCRRVLRHAQDVEDAFQATFLVLAGKAGSIRRGEALASWLHGVAYRTAMSAKRDAARWRKHEGYAARPVAASQSVAVAWDDVQAVLDQEVENLPPIYRTAFVLCHLNGLSHAEAAQQLGVKQGTLASRLAAARKRLEEALARRGILLSALLTALAVSGGVRAAVPGLLAEATARWAARFVTGSAPGLSEQVRFLVDGVTKTMFAANVKLATVLMLTFSLFGTGAVVLHLRSATARTSSAIPPTSKQWHSLDLSRTVSSSR